MPSSIPWTYCINNEVEPLSYSLLVNIYKLSELWQFHRKKKTTHILISLFSKIILFTKDPGSRELWSQNRYEYCLFYTFYTYSLQKGNDYARSEPVTTALVAGVELSSYVSANQVCSNFSHAEDNFATETEGFIETKESLTFIPPFST